MNPVVRIGSRQIGFGEPCYIIAEAGVNHNGNINLALKLVDAAKAAGADCVKFQTFQAENLVTRQSPKAGYQLKTTDPAESQLNMLKKLELSMEAHEVIMKHCREIGIEFLSTPYSLEDIDRLAKLGVPAFKVASGQLVEPFFLRHMAKYGKPMIVSTGMGDMDETREAVQSVASTNHRDLILLHCTTNYPGNPTEANLRAMVSLASEFGVPCGYSDHTPTHHCAFASIALGATVIEKHLTLDKTMEGPDQSSSSEPQEFRELVDGIRLIESALGDGIKRPTESEKVNMFAMRRSLVARRGIAPGEKFTLENVCFKRPSNGLSPRRVFEVLEKKAAREIPADTAITEDSVQW